MCERAQARAKSSAFCTDEGQKSLQAPGSSSLLSLVSIPAVRDPPVQLLPEVKAGSAHVILATSACWAPPAECLLSPSCHQIAGEHLLSQRGADRTNLASSGLMPPVDSPRKRKFPAAPKDSLKSSLFFGKWCKRNLTWTW